MKHFIKYWLPVVVWAGFIFFLSHQPGLKSDFPFVWDLIFRKIAHIGEYFILNLLLVRALFQNYLSKKQILFWAAIISLLYAASDEFHQGFILERTAAVKDVAIDGLGILLSTFLISKRVIKLKRFPPSPFS
jgi:VanZ family protein